MKFMFYFLLSLLLFAGMIITIVGSLWVLWLIMIEWINFDYVEWIRRKR